MKAIGTIAITCHHSGSQNAATESANTISQNTLRCMLRL